ncbi:D-glycero-beta-D-manno-heptose 1,7-bisphosphate 7-phosphatase [Candidatus Poribacteria bacterium]|nr:D-glycero-beta-D-manno-heptose 1,7-bisphosphate 7-phosphatase [Candidatus Poribacteria bacterium]
MREVRPPIQRMNAIFLDRDGVINRNLDNDYVKSWDEFEFIPNSLEAIKCLTDAGYPLIVITNQACINKGLVLPQTLDWIHQEMLSEIEHAGGYIQAIYHCPHRDEDQCDCRKPKPGMLIQASHEHHIDLPNSYLIGDSMRDIEAGKRIGCRTFLVLTGNGSKAHQQQIEAPASRKNIQPKRIFADLYAAALWILSHDTQGQ